MINFIKNKCKSNKKNKNKDLKLRDFEKIKENDGLDYPCKNIITII